MKYDLIQTTNYQKFIEQINSKLYEGWKLHGNTQIMNDEQEYVYVYHQALIKEIE